MILTPSSPFDIKCIKKACAKEHLEIFFRASRRVRFSYVFHMLHSMRHFSKLCISSFFSFLMSFGLLSVSCFLFLDFWFLDSVISLYNKQVDACSSFLAFLIVKQKRTHSEVLNNVCMFVFLFWINWESV